MKKIILALLVSVFIPAVFAQGELIPEVNAGVAPDSIFYGIDVFFDNLKAQGAVNISERARIRLEIAQERAAEMQQMALENKLEAMAKAKLEQDKQISDLEEIHQNEDLDEEIRISLQERLQKHILVLERVREKVPDVAKSAIDNAINSSSKVFEKNQALISSEKREDIDVIKAKIQQGAVKIRQASGYATTIRNRKA